MKASTSIKALAGALALVVVAGCNQVEPVAPAPEETLSKPAASEINACPKYTGFIRTFASEITSCAMNAQSFNSCSSRIAGAFEPMLTCLDIPVPNISSVDDLVKMSTDISNAIVAFENNTSKAIAFVNCLCGEGSWSGSGGSGVGSSPAGFGGSITPTGFGGGASGSGSFGGSTTPTGFGGGAGGGGGFSGGN